MTGFITFIIVTIILLVPWIAPVCLYQARPSRSTGICVYMIVLHNFTYQRWACFLHFSIFLISNSNFSTGSHCASAWCGFAELFDDLTTNDFNESLLFHQSQKKNKFPCYTCIKIERRKIKGFKVNSRLIDISLIFWLKKQCKTFTKVLLRLQNFRALRF